MGFLQAIGSTDMWMLRIGGATFQATAMTQRRRPGAAAANCGGPPLPVPPGSLSPCDSVGAAMTSPPEQRHVTDSGALFVNRTVQINGRIYGVMFMRQGADQLAKFDRKHETPPDSAGQAFVNSFQVANAPATH
jgi:hypothetical protein